MGALDDDALILLLARQVLGGPRDEGRSSYQVALTICEGCRRGFQLAQGDSIEVPAEVVEMASCDAQHIGRVDDDSDAHTHAQHSSLSDTHVGARQSSLSQTHVGATARPARAVQPVPPAVRRAVLRRDHGRCRVPGCRHATFVDVHHLALRSEGGGNEAENLITLCSAHHRASHRGALLIHGNPTRGLVFAHADGTPYGAVPSAHVAEAQVKACRALQLMGFREGEAKRALLRISADPELELEQVIRLALRQLSAV